MDEVKENDLLKVDRSDFACSCRDENDSDTSAYRTNLVKEWVKHHLSNEYWTVTDSNIVTAVIYRLGDYHASVDSIDTDQWAGISASTWPAYPDNPFSVWIQCDEIEDGFAFVYKAFYDHYGEKNDSKWDENWKSRETAKSAIKK